MAILLSSPEVWERGHGPSHPLKPERLQRTFELIEAFGLLHDAQVEVIPPRIATDDELALFHTREYIRGVHQLSDGSSEVHAFRYGFGPGDNPIFSGMFESEARKVGSALLGAELLLDDPSKPVFSYSGGLHHGGPNFASGFCVFNDAAVALSWLTQQGKRVAYVDIDVHHGDGVQAAFYNSDEVLTISLHQDGRTLFPGTGFVSERGEGHGEGFSVNIPLPPLTTDALYLHAFREIVPTLIQRFQPDVLVTQLGVDTHAIDPLANMRLTTLGHEDLFREFRACNLPWLALGGGGYALDVVPRSWTLAFAVMAEAELPDQLPAGYIENYGGSRLHDENRALPEQPEVESAVALVVSQVKEAFAIK